MAGIVVGMEVVGERMQRMGKVEMAGIAVGMEEVGEGMQCMGKVVAGTAVGVVAGEGMQRMGKVVARTAIWMKMNFILGDHVLFF